VKIGRCPICGFSVLIKLNNNEISVHCIHCNASAVIVSLILVLNLLVPDLQDKHVYEMSSRGPLWRFLKSRCNRLTYSEFFDDVPPGSFKDSIQCQDVQSLTFQNNTFDIVTCTEVFEHVQNDIKGFSEVHRVLKPGGLFIFTVPLLTSEETIERVATFDGQLRMLMPPEYHGDWLRGSGRVLCFRNYGRDIISRLLISGFGTTQISPVEGVDWWGYARPVILAGEPG
jgi:SAM-dependent methyltransferase